MNIPDVADDLAELMQNQGLFSKSVERTFFHNCFCHYSCPYTQFYFFTEMETLKKQYEENHRSLLTEQNVSEQRLQRLESAVVGVETDRKAYLRKHAQDLIELKQVVVMKKFVTELN